MAEGWTYGPPRDDAAKKHPDLGPAAAHVMAIRNVAGEAEELMLGENRGRRCGVTFHRNS
jgi:hypothetical protein